MVVVGSAHTSGANQLCAAFGTGKQDLVPGTSSAGGRVGGQSHSPLLLHLPQELQA